MTRGCFLGPCYCAAERRVTSSTGLVSGGRGGRGLIEIFTEISISLPFEKWAKLWLFHCTIVSHPTIELTQTFSQKRETLKKNSECLDLEMLWTSLTSVETRFSIPIFDHHQLKCKGVCSNGLEKNMKKESNQMIINSWTLKHCPTPGMAWLWVRRPSTSQSSSCCWRCHSLGPSASF